MKTSNSSERVYNMVFVLLLAIVCVSLVSYTLYRELRYRDVRLVTGQISDLETPVGTPVGTPVAGGSNNAPASRSGQEVLTIYPDALWSLGGAGLLGSVVLVLWGRRMFSAAGNMSRMKEDGLSAFLRSVLLFVFSAGVFLSVMLLCLDLIFIL
jgi:hypothetical protein